MKQKLYRPYIRQTIRQEQFLAKKFSGMDQRDGHASVCIDRDEKGIELNNEAMTRRGEKAGRATATGLKTQGRCN
jgi:hypothetical protein